MTERNIEGGLKRRIEEATGCKCLKFVSPGYCGVPDRIVLGRNGKVCFIETKAPKRRETIRQQYVQKLLRGFGFKVFSSVDSVSQIPEIIEWLIKNEF